jgi:beta-lactamase class A
MLRIGWCVRDRTGAVIADNDRDTVFATASLGKVLLLMEVAHHIYRGEISLDDPCPRGAPVADSGLWQHLSGEMSVADACILVGAVSDNQATNGLMELLGIGSLESLGEQLGVPSLRLHDIVRDVRTDPPALSSSSASDASAFMHLLGTGTIIAPGVADQVRSWLGHGVDHSLALAPFALDPLIVHQGPLVVVNKTGADQGIRADMGWLSRGDTAVSYAILANWTDPADEVPAVVQMRAFGEEVMRLLSADRGTRA